MARLTRRTGRSFRSDLDVAAGGIGMGMMRDRLRRWLAGNGVPETLADDLLVAVGEACANALEHSVVGAAGKHSTVRVDATISRGRLRVRVVDRGRWLDRTGQPPRPDRGRGIVLMKALVDEVRIDSGRRGTTVHLLQQVPTPGRAEAHGPRPLGCGVGRRLRPAPAPAPGQDDAAPDAEPSPPTPDE